MITMSPSFKVGTKTFSIMKRNFSPVIGPSMNHRSVDAIVAQGGHEGHGLPADVRYLGFDALTAWCPAPQRRHVGFGPGLIDEHQARGINPSPILGPLRPPTSDIGTILFGSNQRLFCK